MSTSLPHDPSHGHESHGASSSAELALLPQSAELELALFAQSMSETSFEEVVAKAVALVGGTVLFVLPAIAIEDCQRVAAVSTGSAGKKQILLVQLSEDGETIRVENAAASSSTIADLAASYAGLMERIHPLAS